MGKCETASALVGLKILVSQLLSQINETNFNLIKEMLYDGFIEDENDFLDQSYNEIINSSDIPKNYLEFKEYLENEFNKKNKMYDDIIFDKELLVPIKEILSTDRWGHERYGTNSKSCPIDFDLSVDVDKYKDIKNYSIVFILKQSSY
jgi:hypothetical protein